jgi:hypothetical protein
MNGRRSSLVRPPQEHRLDPSPMRFAPFLKGTILSFKHFEHRKTLFDPAIFPLFAMGFPSISMMSIAKSITRAFVIAVPTP